MSSEFLRHFTTEAIEAWHWEDMLKAGRPIDIPTLKDFLVAANRFLITEPGPNLLQRQQSSEDWLGFWIDFLEDMQAHPGMQKPSTILPLEKIGSYVEKNYQEGKEPGVLFIGGGEGHWGHRWAINYMLAHCRPILLFEQESYVEGKARGGSFLPLEARLSMWTYYQPSMLISVLPEREADVPEDIHYQVVFNETGAKYCFAEETDPNRAEKRARGEPAAFTLIPHLPVLPTTDMVRSLGEDFPPLFRK